MEEVQDSKKEIRTKYCPKLSKFLHSIPIGNQLRDISKNFVLDHFNKKNVSKLSLFMSRIHELTASFLFAFVHLWEDLYDGLEDNDTISTSFHMIIG